MGRALSPFNGQAHMDAVIRGQTAVGLQSLPALAHSPLSIVPITLHGKISQEVRNKQACQNSAQAWPAFMTEAAPPGSPCACTEGSPLCYQVRDALTALEGLTETARLDVMWPLEVL